MGLRRFLSIASAHRVRLVAIPTLLGLFALAASFTVPSQYVATTTVRVMSGNPVVQSAEGVAAMLRSREVAEMVAANVGAMALPGLEGADAIRAGAADALTSVWEMARYGYRTTKPAGETAVDRARDALTVTVLPGGAYVQVSATAETPAAASAIANGAIDALLQRSAVLAASPMTDRVRFLESQLAEAKTRATSARSAVLTYSLKNDAVPNESVRAAVATLNSARAAVKDIELSISEAGGRLAEVERQLVVTPSQVFTTTQTSAKPDTRTTTSAPNPVYLNLRERANTLRQEITALETRRVRAEANAAASDDALGVVMAHDSELGALNQELAIADDQYATAARDLAAAHSDAARLAPPVQQIGLAPTPDYPSYPVRVGFLGIGLAAGLAISFLMTLVLMATDRTLRSAADVMAVLEDLPLLAVLASNPRPNRREVVGS
jgi:uncharacterized protein involved in exopolysaccharide biosynthesis